MISVSEAKDLVRNNSNALSPVSFPLQQAAMKVLAEDVVAITAIPPFNQSSMDGYAFRFEDYHAHKNLKIEGEIPAGYNQNFIIKTQQAVRIFTGAPLPQGADTVVMQEKTIVENNQLLITNDQIKKGENVRLCGTEIAAGALAMSKGNYLSAAAIGFLAGVGIKELKAYPHPTISIIITGKELQAPGEKLHHGQVYESNSFMLKAALQQLHIDNVKIIWVEDDLNLLQNALQNALENADLILLTGGISAGDYDYVLRAANLCGVNKLFHKVKQKPGKPLYFGKKENRLVFGLPGNPSSVLTCFYEYVMPALERLSQRKNIIRTLSLPLIKSYQKNAGLTHFLKGQQKENKVMPLSAQESYRLSSFALADCLICLEEDKTIFKEGDMVEVHLLPVY